MGIKISELPFLTPPSPSDFIPIARGDTTGRISASELNNTVVVANIPNISTLTPVISTNIGNGDRFLIRAGGFNTGEVEIFTGNNGNEPIHVRQYSGSTTVARTFTLLDSSGYTSIPSRLGVGTTTIARTLTIQGDSSFTGNTTTPLVDITQSGTGLGLRTNKIGLNTTNTAYQLTVIGAVSASSNIFSEATITDNRHLATKKYVDDSISLNLSDVPKLNSSQVFTNTNTFNSPVTVNSTLLITASSANPTYNVTHFPVFINNPNTSSRQIYVRSTSEIRSIIGAEPSFNILPVSKGGIGFDVGDGSGVVMANTRNNPFFLLPRSGIDTRTSFPTPKSVTVIGNQVGDSFTTFIVSHNLNTRSIIAQVYLTDTPYTQVFPSIKATTLNTISVEFSQPPSFNQYTVVVIG